MFIAAAEQGGLARSISVLSVLDGNDRDDRVSEISRFDGRTSRRSRNKSAPLWSDDVPLAVLNRAVREAERSNLFAGESAEEWSPLVESRPAKLVCATRRSEPLRHLMRH